MTPAGADALPVASQLVVDAGPALAAGALPVAAAQARKPLAHEFHGFWRGGCSRGRGPAVAAVRFAGADLSGALSLAAGLGAPLGALRFAVGQVDDPARCRHLAQHARGGRQAHPNGGRSGSRQGVPERGAQAHRSGSGHPRRHRPGRAAAHDRPPLSRARDRRRADAVRHGHRQCHRGVPGRALSGPWHRPGRDDLRPALAGAQSGQKGGEREAAAKPIGAGATRLARVGRGDPGSATAAARRVSTRCKRRSWPQIEAFGSTS